MANVPWRISAQSVVLLNLDREPEQTLSFSVDHNQSDLMRLRITPSDGDKPAIELQFMTGGYVVEPVVHQPRWLKAFERPDPNLKLDDDDAWAAAQEALPSDEQRAAADEKRNAFILRRDNWAKDHGGDLRIGGPKPADADVDQQDIVDQQEGFNREQMGYQQPQGVSTTPSGYNASPGMNTRQGGEDPGPNTPAAQQQQARSAGLDSTAPSDNDRKGMVSQPGGGMAGEMGQTSRVNTTQTLNAPVAPRGGKR